MPMVAKDGIGGQMSDSLMRQLGLETPDLGEILSNGVPEGHYAWSCEKSETDPFEPGGQGTQMKGFFGIHLSHEERWRLLDALRHAGIVEYGEYPYCFLSMLWYKPDLKRHATEIESLTRALGTEYKLRVISVRSGRLGKALMLKIIGDAKPVIQPGKTLFMAVTARAAPYELSQYADGRGDFDENPFELEVTGTLRVGFGKIFPEKYRSPDPLFAEE